MIFLAMIFLVNGVIPTLHVMSSEREIKTLTNTLFLIKDFTLMASLIMDAF